MFEAQKQQDLEGIGKTSSLEALLDVRVRTRAAVWEIARRLQPGIVEEEAREIAAGVLQGTGLRQGWHRILVRCGPNTTKNFRDHSAPGVILRENDVFFIDIGPIFDGTEGDAGDTFVLGDEPEMVRAADEVKELWRAVRNQWRDEGSSGADLYRFAEATATAMGWQLNLQLTGHRLSEFPHKAHYDGKLAKVEFCPSSGLWVLEIQIRHPVKEFGAFFEDLLLVDDDLQSLSYAPPQVV
jgi:methionyl aminopeptidase